ncbi:MAG: metallophosphoesterase, partial [Akkermansiaceae bacterium]|nr:metallophosphoesterase [Akkermansiaceae bacterium]
MTTHARLLILCFLPCLAPLHADDPSVFGEKFPKLDGMATGEWWKVAKPVDKPRKGRKPKKIIDMDVPREDVVAFAVYTHDKGVLKLSAQLYPLKPDEPKVARLEFKNGGAWKEAASIPVTFPGWSAHFRIENWDNTQSVPYRVRHGEKAMFEGLIRKDPVDKDVIVVANMSCNSSRTPGQRPLIVKNLLAHDPDLLFFAGDQTYHHTQHTAGWLEFGLQFRDVLKDRPTITIPDDHDVGQANLWGQEGKQAETPAG